MEIFMKIYVDAMGGDNAPQAIVEGAISAIKEYDLNNLILVGQPKVIENELSKYGDFSKKVQILPAADVIGFDDEPVEAIRTKKESSLVVALDAMKGDEDAVLISAGSTGALLAGGQLKLGRIKGVKRPALGSILPQRNGSTFLMDIGANADCRPEFLLQFAQIAVVYVESVLNISNPSVGLLNIGTEAEKGNTLTKKVFGLLQESSLNFKGNVESRDLMTTDVDILITDGFTGNIALKLAEGMANYLVQNLKATFMNSHSDKPVDPLVKAQLKTFKDAFDADAYGGAPFLGVKGGIIKAHGSSNAYAFKNAIRQAIAFSENNVVEKITTLISETPKKA